ncbi:MAG: proteasome assembly chaperone family protein [Candidatus Micrarchaeota archaeon]|nr:proteasome assembly chaperone family protein [Candidatus Micrarchaeota archaeon]
MDGTIIRVSKDVKLNKPILIAGLPGIGNVGKLAVDHIRKELGATKFATLYSEHFPHQVIMLKSGGIRLVNNRFYYLKSKAKNGNDIVLLTGDAQAVTPEGQYEVNSKIVEFFKTKLGGTFIYTIGGYSIAQGIVKSPRVFANVSRKEIMGQFKDLGIHFGESKGIIWGSAGLIIAFAKMQGMDGICLMGETAFLELDANAAKAVIATLAKKLNLEIKTGNLDKLIKKTNHALRGMEQQVGLGMPPAGGVPLEGGVDLSQKPSYIR